MTVQQCENLSEENCGFRSNKSQHKLKSCTFRINPLYALPLAFVEGWVYDSYIFFFVLVSRSVLEVTL